MRAGEETLNPALTECTQDSHVPDATRIMVELAG